MHHRLTRRSTQTAGWRTWMAAALGGAALVASGLGATSASAADTVWLCKPGLANNPCESDLTTTVKRANGSSFVNKHAKPASNPPIDCFYVYPTVSSQFAYDPKLKKITPNATLSIDPEETQIAINQASRFSQVCKVYAPMYPQLTIIALLFGLVTPEASLTAYLGVLSAWQDYLANFNHGRGVVLIGHSQGSAVLRQLVKEQIDPNPALRHQLVSALLLGGQVTVPTGGVVGGDFQHVSACQLAWQTGCVVAYSSFLKEPPDPSGFGRVASPIFGTGPNSNLQILCVNPAALFRGDRSGRSRGDESGRSFQGDQSESSEGDWSRPSEGGQSGPLLPYQSTSPFPGLLAPYYIPVASAPTPWVSTPGQYSAECKQANGASWLEVTKVSPAGDPREQVKETLGPLWGTHLADINLALGNLVGLVGVQAWIYQWENFFRSTHGRPQD